MSILFSSFLEKFLDCLPHHPQRLRNPVAVLPTYIPRNEVARGTVRFLCGGSYMALVGFRLHRLPPSHRGYILTHPLGNVNTFFQVSLKKFLAPSCRPPPSVFQSLTGAGAHLYTAPTGLRAVQGGSHEGGLISLTWATLSGLPPRSL